jgi:glyoxylase-like metal-dependent hydrolase (beta-lactamase superfamily II)/rhodanese-related sulfurtransferase
MFIRQLYTGCLSEAAYYIDSEGEAAIIDPLRDTDEYVHLAGERNAKIKYIFETHFHADFVSGHLDLAKKTGAPIVYGPDTKTKFPIHLAQEGEVFHLGKVTLEVIHTPGHTLESTCYLLKDENKKPYCIFTGDTLFVGDVGRPDLSSGNLDKEELASHLFDSLQKLKQLPDHVTVYPAHGAGSSCGKNMGPENSSTIGEQKKSNYAMLAKDKEKFIQEVTDGLEPPPSYFVKDARINREGYKDLDEVMKHSSRPLPVAVFKKEISKDVWILDTRSPEKFTDGFIPGAVNIGLKGRFAEWAGILIPYNQPVLLVTDTGEEEETIIRMARVGFDNVAGYLEGGFEAWKKAGEKMDMIINVEADELAMDMHFDKKLMLMDVRKPAEFAEGHVKGAANVPLDEMTDPVVVSKADDALNMYIHCQSGYRSVIACSLLKRDGFHNLRNVTGGFKKISLTPQIRIIKEERVLN